MLIPKSMTVFPEQGPGPEMVAACPPEEKKPKEQRVFQKKKKDEKKKPEEQRVFQKKKKDEKKKPKKEKTQQKKADKNTAQKEKKAKKVTDLSRGKTRRTS